VWKNIGVVHVLVCTLNFGAARKNVGVWVRALNFGTVRKNVGVRVHAKFWRRAEKCWCVGGVLNFSIGVRKNVAHAKFSIVQCAYA
jgi:hypothetical protein